MIEREGKRETNRENMRARNIQIDWVKNMEKVNECVYVQRERDIEEERKIERKKERER